MYPQLMFLAKKKNIKKFHLKINIFYSGEILLYIAWVCLHNDLRHLSFVPFMGYTHIKTFLGVYLFV